MALTALLSWLNQSKPCHSVNIIIIFTQRHSVAKNIKCFRQNLFVCLWVCACVCQDDNFHTTKHTMMKLGGRWTVQKSRPSSNLGVIAPQVGCATPQMWRFAESRCMTQNVNKAMRAGETLHRTQHAHSIAPACSYDIGKISAGCLVYSFISLKKYKYNDSCMKQ